MTYWLHAYCEDCKSPSPPLFVEFNGKVSLYPVGDYVEAGGEWIANHAAPGHDVRLVHENSENFPGPDRL